MIDNLHGNIVESEMKTFDLRQYVYTFPNVLTQEYCESLVKKIEDSDWKKHHYHNSASDKTFTYDDDLFCKYLEDGEDNTMLMDAIRLSIISYFRALQFDWFASWSGYSRVRLNKYSQNTRMRKHFDGIKSVFDGTRRGDPTLSILGALNDDYEGGELIFWNDTKIELKAGSIMVFPSTFLYPHGVNPVTKGTRYSFVSWMF